MGEGDVLAVGVGGGAGHRQVEDGRCEIGYRKIIAFRRRIKWLLGAWICDNHAAAEDPVVDAAAYAAAATAAPTVATSNDYVAAALGETTKVAAVAEEGAGVLQFLAKANTVFSVITGAYSVYTLINDYFHPDKTPTAQTLK